MSEFLNLNKFKILSKIGEGAFGEVFKVEENDSKNIFAAKISLSELNQEDPKLFTDLKGEVSILSQLNHSSVLRFIGYSPFNFSQESYPVIISEYSTNGSLGDIIKLDREFKAPQQWTDTKKLINIYGIASAMSYLHSHNIIHRDLKPDNILEDENYFPKIADFGLSKLNSIDTKTKEGFKGTPMYVAPEVYLSEAYSKAGDVYAFSFIVYELLTLEEPFKNINFYTLFSKVIMNNERPNFNFPIPNCYKDMISRCWSPNPEDRPTFQKIVEELRTKKEFIIDTIDENEFYEFVDFIDEKGSSLETSKKMKTIILKEEINKKRIHNVRTFNNLPFESQLLYICDMIENENEEEEDEDEPENSGEGSLYDIKELLEYIETFDVKAEGKYFGILEDDEEASIEIICQQPPKISISSEAIEKMYDKSSIDSNKFNEHINKFESVEIEIKYPTKSFECIYEEVLKIKNKHEERVIIKILIKGIENTDMRFRNNENIDSIVIGNDVLKIAGEPVYISRTYSFAGGGGSFCKCSSLKQITIPSSVTEIGIASFYECSSLTQIAIPSSVTKIENSAFWECSSLSQISIPSSVTEIGECAFYKCSSLTQITIPSSVTEIASMAFYGCSSLTRISIPSSVTLIKEMAFVECSLLRRIIIPSSVTEIGKRAFKGCSSLTQITFSSSVTTIGKHVFENCSSLTQITIPSCITKIEKCAFKGCSSLEQITFPSSITHIQWNAFENCSSLTNITISSSKTVIEGDAFRGCLSLKQIFIPSFEIDIDYSAFENCSSFELASIYSSSVTENCLSSTNEISVKKMAKISEEEIIDSQNKNEPQQKVSQSNDTSQFSNCKINEIDSYSASKNDVNSLIDESITTRDSKGLMNYLSQNCEEEEIFDSQNKNEPQQKINQSNDTSQFSNDKISEIDSYSASKNDVNSSIDESITTRDSKGLMNYLSKNCEEEEEIIDSQKINEHEQEINQSNDASQFSNDKINEIDSYSASKNDVNSLIDEFITTRDSKGLMNYLSKNCNEEEILSVFDRCFLVSKDFYSKICEEGILLNNAVAHHKYAMSLILASNDLESEPAKKKNYKKAKIHLEESIKQGFVPSYFSYARLQYEVFKENNEAFLSAKEGAERGEKYSKCLLGFFVAHGIGTEKNFNKGVKMMLESNADDFYENFATDYGIYYSNIENEQEKTFYWFEKAFNMRQTKATINNYGICFMKGIGVSKNVNKAIEIFEIGLNLNDMNSMYHLGFIFEENDHEMSQMMYKKAADHGNVHAQLKYGSILLKTNPENSTKYFKLASDGGSKEAKEFLAKKYLNENDTENAYLYIHSLIKTGNFSVPLEYASKLYKTKKYDLAFEYFYIISKFNHPIANYFVGLMYYYGQGCIQNRQKSYEIMKSLSDNGIDRATEFLDNNFNY